VAPLLDGRVLTGGVKWNAKPIPAEWHRRHMEGLQRLAKAGVRWAHTAAAPESPLLWVAAGGFEPGFVEAIRAARTEVFLWDLGTLYDEATPA
jgi:hypothetical protein